MRKLLVSALAALALPAAAAAGGWATVGVAPLPEDGAAAGTTWTPTLKVLQHGRTPLDGVQPSITIRNDDTGATRTFVATPTGTPGEYRASVVFPDEGTWRFAIDDDFSQVHTFAPVTIGTPDSGGGGIGWTLGGSIALALMLAALLVLGARRRSTVPTPAPLLD